MVVAEGPVVDRGSFVGGGPLVAGGRVVAVDEGVVVDGGDNAVVAGATEVETCAMVVPGRAVAVVELVFPQALATRSRANPTQLARCHPAKGTLAIGRSRFSLPEMYPRR